MARLVLIVEGADDLHLFVHLLRHHRIPLNDPGIDLPDRVTIRDGGGANNILESLPVRVKALSNEPASANLGIILDADLDLAQRWQAILSRLEAVGYLSLPTSPDPRGTILSEEGLPQVGVWLMPDNRLPGELEHFARMLVPTTDSLWPRAEQCVEQIPLEERRFPAHDVTKAVIHTWLAWQSEPGKPIGQALTKRFLDAEASQAANLIAWIRRLSGLDVS